jgi:hypothetical protein
LKSCELALKASDFDSKSSELGLKSNDFELEVLRARG